MFYIEILVNSSDFQGDHETSTINQFTKPRLSKPLKHHFAAHQLPLFHHIVSPCHLSIPGPIIIMSVHHALVQHRYAAVHPVRNPSPRATVTMIELSGSAWPGKCPEGGTYLIT